MSILLHEYHDTNVINDIIYKNDNKHNSFSWE